MSANLSEPGAFPLQWLIVIFRLILFATAITCASCGRAGFTTELSGEATISKGTASSALSEVLTLSPLDAIDFDANAALVSRGLTKSQISLAKLETASLRIASPSTQDFSFLDTVELYAQAAEHQVLLASKSGVLTTTSANPSLSLDVVALNIAEYTYVPMSFVLKLTGTHPSVEVRLQANLRMAFEAAP